MHSIGPFQVNRSSNITDTIITNENVPFVSNANYTFQVDAVNYIPYFTLTIL